VIGLDTIALTEQNRKLFDKILLRTPEYSSPRVKTYERFPYYVFETTSLGFINCDIFVEEELYPFTVQVTDSESDVFIILDSLHAIVYPDTSIVKRINNEMKTSQRFTLPTNKAVTVVSYRTGEANRHYFVVTKSNTSKKEISVELQLKTLNEIKEAIKQL
jgi:hypothetical protein